jgi:hypothetical protein
MRQTEGSRRALTDKQVEEAVTLRLDGREQLMSHFGLGASAARRAEPVIKAIIRERERASGILPTDEGVEPMHWNRKTTRHRQRELRGRKKMDPYPELLKVQMLISDLCAALESVRIGDYHLDEVSLWRITDIYDDLISVGAWTDRTLSVVQGRLNDSEVREKIKVLRNTNGRTPSEARAMLALADRLERKLSSRLPVKAGA